CARPLLLERTPPRLRAGPRASGTEFPGRPGQHGGVASCRQRDDPESIREKAQDLERLRSDGSRGAEYGKTLTIRHGVRPDYIGGAENCCSSQEVIKQEWDTYREVAPYQLRTDPALRP